MEIINKQGSQYFLRFKQQEKFFNEFKKFCRNESLGGGFFSGIGATLSVELGYYDLEEHEYYFTTYDNAPIEVTNIKGNISFTSEDEYTIHAHGTIANKNQEVRGGHFNKLIVGPTLEIAVFPSKNKMRREYDEETDLELLTR